MGKGKAKPKRSAEEICRQVRAFTIGGERVEFREPSIAESIAARAKIGDLLGKWVGEAFDPDAPDDAMFERMLPLILGAGLATVAELPALYAEGVDLSGASDQELVDAGLEVLGWLFPLIVSGIRATLKALEEAKKAGLKM